MSRKDAGIVWFSKAVAYLVVHRPGLLILAAAAITTGCAGILHWRSNFDSEVLNLLPARFESVQALKTLNNDFVQARELTFALRGEPELVADFGGHFVEALRKEPWVVRVFSGSPMESPEEAGALHALVPPLLMNLEAPAFEDALRLLAPDRIRSRLQRLREQMMAGSVGVEMQLSTDPLGLLGAAMKPLSSIYGVERGQGLVSEDGRLRVVPVVTNQASLGQPDCKLLMQQVEGFIKRVRQSWSGPAPEVLVTGRSAYVAQISASMERDVQVTSSVSILAVAALFYLGFRRLLPLLGIIITLGLSCFVAFALGCLLFENFNMIAIAFCSILVGLGDDFSLLLYNRYLDARVAREEHETAIVTAIAGVSPGIFYVSLTTGIGFLALLLSGSAGFAQLGTLIAIGIMLCGASMIVLLFLFIRPQQTVMKRDPIGAMISRYADWVLRRSRPLATMMLAVFVLTVAAAVAPIRPLRFDTSPRSLEPKDSPAAIALKAITQGITAASEPVVVIVEAADAQQAHDRWVDLTKHLETMVQSGELASFSSPAPLMRSPARVRQNQERLRSADLNSSRVALEQALRDNGFNPDAFRSALGILDQLEISSSAEGQFDIRNLLPPQSAWWFLLDRYFAAKPHVAAAYLKPAKPLTTSDEQSFIERRIKECGVPLRVTGWSYAMVSLVPWAKHELLVFSFAVGGLILVLLGIAYRRWRPWLIHTASLAFAVAATVATLKATGIQINMLNALAFPLVIGVGVDYGMHVLAATREEGDPLGNLLRVLKPVVICGLTTITGFGSLTLARNPALSGLGLVCSLGIAWCLIITLVFTLPLSMLGLRKR